MSFLERVVSYFPSKEKISCFWEKIPSFQIIQERSCPGASPFRKDYLFRTFEEKIIFSFFLFFFEKDHVLFSVQGVRSYFREKRNSIFPDNTRKIIFQCDLFGSLQDAGKKKIWFSVQCFKKLSMFSEKIIFNYKELDTSQHMMCYTSKDF